MGSVARRVDIPVLLPTRATARSRGDDAAFWPHVVRHLQGSRVLAEV
jgi:hypothetical protein